MKPTVYTTDQTGAFIETTLQAAFPFLGEGGHVVSFVGAGGKTTLMYRMASLCASKGQRVLLSTTTHIRIPLDGSYVQGMDAIRQRWSQGQYAVVGNPCAGSKLSMLPLEELTSYMAQADIVFLEADGSRELPLKVPAGNEPVLLPRSDLLVAVCGLSALGRPLKEVCFRIDTAEKVLGKSRTEITAEEDLIRILTSQQGGRRNCGSRGYYMVLNQCDNIRRQQSASRIAAAIRQSGYPNICATCLKQDSGQEGEFTCRN